jgi:hypothetical protein
MPYWTTRSGIGQVQKSDCATCAVTKEPKTAQCQVAVEFTSRDTRRRPPEARGRAGISVSSAARGSLDRGQTSPFPPGSCMVSLGLLRAGRIAHAVGNRVPGVDRRRRPSQRPPSRSVKNGVSRQAFRASIRCSVSPPARAPFECMSMQKAQPLISEARVLTGSRRGCFRPQLAGSARARLRTFRSCSGRPAATPSR